MNRKYRKKAIKQKGGEKTKKMNTRRKSIVAIAIAAIMMISVMTVLAPSTVAQHPEEAVNNTLRVYGRCVENAAFPYDNYQGPFSIQSTENPPKDFVVFNPAFMYHLDDDSLGEFGNYFLSAIKADGDANEKVHLRTWYVPKLDEPVGLTYPNLVPGEKVSNYEEIGMGDIVLEYTYILLKPDTLDPKTGSAGGTKMVFPMAGLGNQPGLDRMDVNGDGIPETMSIDEIWGKMTGTVTNPVVVEGIYDDEKTTRGIIMVSPKATQVTGMRLAAGESVQFMDYMVTLISVDSGSMTASVGVSYIGNENEEYIDDRTLTLGGDDSVVVGRYYSPPISSAMTESEARDAAVSAMVTKKLPARPFWVTLDAVGSGFAKLTPHRILMTGETFFVDCVEYDVAAILVEDVNLDTEIEPEIKYITLRNPLPKGDGKLVISILTQEKCRIPDNESLWMLPPFNYEHDMIDDINIPDYIQGDPNGYKYPDEQYPDNPGADLDSDYDTIEKRWITDVGALDGDLLICWIDEQKEERFDTNLLEEKFEQEGVEENWMWKNIETYPWDYTEFVLPELPDKPTETGYTTGDYILVSSFITEDSTVDKTIRMKFVYDTVDGTGIYVTGVVQDPCPWDLNDDNVVDISDIVILAGHWGEDWPPGDFNHDGTIDISDIVIMANHWGACPVQ